jgi:hypothetical protein
MRSGIEPFSISMLGFISGIADSLVKGVRLGTDNVAPNKNFREPTIPRPVFHGLDQAATDTQPALPLCYDETKDFATQSHFEKFLFGTMNPPHHLGPRFPPPRSNGNRVREIEKLGRASSRSGRDSQECRSIRPHDPNHRF